MLCIRFRAAVESFSVRNLRFDLKRTRQSICVRTNQQHRFDIFLVSFLASLPFGVSNSFIFSGVAIDHTCVLQTTGGSSWKRRLAAFYLPNFICNLESSLLDRK